MSNYTAETRKMVAWLKVNEDCPPPATCTYGRAKDGTRKKKIKKGLQ